MKNLRKIEEIRLPTKFGKFKMVVFENRKTKRFAAAITLGVIKAGDILVRVHSSCLTGDVFGSLLCDCGPQLERALQEILAEGQGVIIYLDQEGRGIGLGNKVKAMKLQEQGLDTVEANLALGLPVDARSFTEAAEIIQSLGVKSVRLLTNNLVKVRQLQGLGIRVKRVSCIVKSAPETKRYLQTKKERMGHLLPKG